MSQEKVDELEPGFIYLIEAAGVFKPGTIRCKLGKSIDKDDRLSQLLRAQPCTTYDMTDSLLCNNKSKTEQLFHQRYRQYNANIPGSREWFDFPPEVLAQVKKDFRTLEKDRAWTPLPPLADPKEIAPENSENWNLVRFLNPVQIQEPISQNHQSPPLNLENPVPPSVENPSPNQTPSPNPEPNPSPNVVEVEIMDEPVSTESAPINNIFVFMSNPITQGRRVKNFIGGLVMTAFAGFLILGSLLQASTPTIPDVGETVNAGLSAAKNNDPNQARQLFRNLQNANLGECEAKLGASLAAAVEESNSLDEFYNLADKPLKVANDQGCIRLRN